MKRATKIALLGVAILGSGIAFFVWRGKREYGGMKFALAAAGCCPRIIVQLGSSWKTDLPCRSKHRGWNCLHMSGSLGAGNLEWVTSTRPDGEDDVRGMWFASATGDTFDVQPCWMRWIDEEVNGTPPAHQFAKACVAGIADGCDRAADLYTSGQGGVKYDPDVAQVMREAARKLRNNASRSTK